MDDTRALETDNIEAYSSYADAEEALKSHELCTNTKFVLLHRKKRHNFGISLKADFFKRPLGSYIFTGQSVYRTKYTTCMPFC
jgi:hypothetical protein